MAVTTITLTPIFGSTTWTGSCSFYIFLDVDIDGSPAPDGTQVAVKACTGPTFVSCTFSTALPTLGGFAFFSSVESHLVTGTRRYQGLENTGGAVSTWTANGASLDITWLANGSFSCPLYTPTTPELLVIPGNAKVELSWTTSIPIDPAPVPQSHVFIKNYIIHRGTTPGFALTSPPNSTSISGTRVGVTAGNVNTFLDTARTNGTVYYYRVVASENLLVIASPGLPYSISNEVHNTPRPQREFWGRVVHA